MARKLEMGRFQTDEDFENALVLDDATATFAAAFAEVCSALATRKSEPGDPYVALRLAQQMKQAADAFLDGEVGDPVVWLPKDAPEH